MVGINAYKQMSDIDGGLDLTRRVLKSIELYIIDLQNSELDTVRRREASIAAITLLQEMSNNIRDELPEAEQEILIKVCGQIIKDINKFVRGEVNDFSKDLAGLRLIYKLVS